MEIKKNKKNHSLKVIKVKWSIINLSRSWF